MQFSSYSLMEFRNSIKDEYPDVSNKALGIIIPFGTSYLYETGKLLSTVTVLKSIYRSRLNVEKEKRVSVTTLITNFEKLINEKQAHCSH
ncbi:Hypothetical protein CINCED_3A021634 [Cinara cedri]|uniref:Uncharacterized protein n=1 Tax=Cinara cedri TaxID=506608 RepID=A0A5E4NIC7_9HEMI|nr:Hypothetical protein CINCED_3A021634 [Cinara cedri]